jgi:pimeloyl-[acyl-carrier protein] methyl ester esterase
MIAVKNFGQTQGQRLVFIHGWAGQAHLWHDWIEQAFGAQYALSTLELPGHGLSEPLASAALWQKALHEALPEDTYVIGWSLGGLMAQGICIEEAHRPPAQRKVKGLICLATTPCFSQTHGWQWGISPELLGQFFQGLQVDASAILNHFWTLQLQGSPNAKPLIRNWLKQLKSWKMPDFASLGQGLELIKQLDHRQALEQLQLPTLWLLGERDPLVAAQPLLLALATLQPDAAVRIIKQAGHSPFLSHPDETAQAIRLFLDKTQPN